MVVRLYLFVIVSNFQERRKALKRLVHIILSPEEHAKVLRAIRQTLSDDPPVEWHRDLDAALEILEESSEEETIKVGGKV